MDIPVDVWGDCGMVEFGFGVDDLSNVGDVCIGANSDLLIGSLFLPKGDDSGIGGGVSGVSGGVSVGH